MMTNNNMPLQSLILVSSLLLAPVVNGQAEFTAITTSVPQDVTGVSLPAFCSKNVDMVKILATIEPATGDDVVVLTHPPDLVTVSSDTGGMLRLAYNEEVGKSALEGGVRIQIPADQLEKIDACCSAEAQVLPGFTALTSLTVSTSAEVTMVGLESSAGDGGNSTSTTTMPAKLKVDVSTSASAYIDYSGGGILEKVTASTSGDVEVIAAQVETLDISTSADADLQVDMAPTSGAVSTSGDLSISVAGGCANIDASTSGECKDAVTSMDLEIVVGEEFTETGSHTCAYSTSGASSLVATPGFVYYMVATLLVTSSLWMDRL